jgi:hypothetical protein
MARNACVLSAARIGGVRSCGGRWGGRQRRAGAPRHGIGIRAVRLEGFAAACSASGDASRQARAMAGC